jgi:hypothetical protein
MALRCACAEGQVQLGRELRSMPEFRNVRSDPPVQGAGIPPVRVKYILARQLRSTVFWTGPQLQPHKTLCTILILIILIVILTLIVIVIAIVTVQG